jgi:hypothetical protein
MGTSFSACSADGVAAIRKQGASPMANAENHAHREKDS